ncbi:sortase [Microlunatus speluncae]|uniref:sortase n=1 Tax=Microlunatus speluncae TaxID=2594267 RepID=UPI001375F135|nr:class E sortase [Microlunatus speluncae]
MGHRRRRRIRPLSIIIGTVVLLACAVVPWLIPWDSLRQPQAVPPAAAPSPGPSAATEPSSTPSTEDAPTSEDVRRLAEEIRAGASAGYDLPVDPREVSSVQTDPGEYRRLGRIEIPSIGLSATFGEGVYGEPLERGPGHWPGTPMPGGLGNSVISGHRNTHTQPFKEIDRLAEGDRIETTLKGGKTTVFTVVETAIVPEDEYKDFVLKQPDDDTDRQVTLFACHPEGNPIFRIVVRAEQRS